MSRADEHGQRGIEKRIALNTADMTQSSSWLSRYVCRSESLMGCDRPAVACQGAGKLSRFELHSARSSYCTSHPLRAAMCPKLCPVVYSFASIWVFLLSFARDETAQGSLPPESSRIACLPASATTGMLQFAARLKSAVLLLQLHVMADPVIWAIGRLLPGP